MYIAEDIQALSRLVQDLDNISKVPVLENKVAVGQGFEPREDY